MGTDGKILLAHKAKYSPSLEKKVTDKKGKVIDGQYPNWRGVVENHTNIPAGVSIDPFHAFVRGAIDMLGGMKARKKWSDYSKVIFRDSHGIVRSYRLAVLDKFLSGAESIGATDIFVDEYGRLLAHTAVGDVIAVPLYLTKTPTEDLIHPSLDFIYTTNGGVRLTLDGWDIKRQLPALQQSTDALTNNTPAKQLTTKAVLHALDKAGIEVSVVDDETAKRLLDLDYDAELQIVYHGSGAKFNNFDHSHMGEGEGAQAYGWGCYVTEVEDIGRTYATGNGKIKFRGFVLEAMHSLEVKEHFSGAERKVLNFLYKWIKRSDNVTTAIEKAKKWASNEYEKYSGRRNWSDQDYKDYFGAISKKDVREWRKEMKEKEENAQQMLSFIETLSVDDFSLPQRHLYTVDIPDDTGSNYLSWEQPMSEKQLDTIEEYLKENYRANRVKIFTDGIAKSNSSNAQEVDAFTRQGENIYHLLEHTIGDDKSVSEMLGSLGYTGISYPAQYQSGGRADNARNYVIFKEKDLKITDHIQFMRTPQGIVYGWMANGKIYLTKAGLNPETPVHEYTHLWAEAMMARNKEGWSNIKSLLKDSPVWGEVFNDPNYSNIKDNEDAVASEVLSRISGRKNAAKMEEEAQKAIDDANGVFEKAKATALLLNMKKALKQFWHWVGKNVFDIKDFKDIDEVTDRVLYDLLNKTKLTEEDKEEIAKSAPRFQIVDTDLFDEERDIVANAKMNGTYMKAPNGKPTNLNEKQWAQVRTKAFKDWFGDWEKAARIEKLRRSKAVKITEADYGGKYDLTRNSAKQWAKDNVRGEYTIADTGENVNVSKVSINEVLSHGERDAAHLKSISSIGKLLHNAIFITETPNAKDNDKYESYRYYVVGIKIDDVNYTAKLVIGVKNGKTYYDHRLTQIEKGSLLDSLNGLSNSVAEKQQTSFIGKDSKLLSILQTNSSKVVDENGEPMVVYHGSNNEFTQFDTARIGSSTGTSDGRGFYFTTDKNYAHSFSKDSNVMDVFLNITNPLSLKEKTITKGQLFDIIKRIDEKEFAADGEHWLVSNYGNYYDIGIDGAIKEAVENEYPYSDNDVELVNSLISASGDFEKVVDSVYETTGKSGEIVPKDNGTIHYVVTSPNQIKSAINNNGHFSVAEDDIRYRAFGGNSGYVGYSMSKRAARARNEGRYPKGDFKKEYHLTEKAFEVLDDIGMIDRGEWHHTSMYGNRTKFYGWAKPWMADAYIENKSAIDKLAREVGVNNDDAIEQLMEDSKAHQAYLVEDEGERRKQETAAHLNALHKEYEQEMSKLIPKEIAVSNGVIVHTEEKDWYATKDGVRLSKRNGKELRNAALEEAKELSKPNVTFEDWLSKREHNELQSVNKAFNEALDELTAENVQQSRLELGNPSAELLSVGVPNKPIILYGNKLFKKSKVHNFSLQDLRNLPLSLQNPIAVFKGSHKDSFAILLDIKLNGHHTLASIEVNKKGEADFNIVSSVFGKEDKGIIKWILDGKLLSVDKEKAQTYISASALNADATYKDELSSAANIIKDFHNPNINADILRDSEESVSEVTTSNTSHYTKAQQQAYAARQIRRAHEMAQTTIKELHLNDKVDIIEDADSAGLEGKRAKAKGWYDPKTDRITIVIGNHSSPQDVVTTILHEAVAHYGLRKLFGNHFDDFIYGKATLL